MWRVFKSTSLYAATGTLLIVLFLQQAGAQVMTSNSYRIQSDSINFGGGLSTSSNYSLESTIGEVGTGFSTSTTFGVGAGYQQMQEVYLSLSGAANVSMSPEIPGVTGGIANGSTTVTVTTDSPSGYMLTIESGESPAMRRGGDSIADYVPVGAPDFDFITGPADSHFGYSPEGIHIVNRFRDDGNDTCNTGSTDSARSCWDGLSTTPEPIASSAFANHPQGATTTIYFRVGVGGAVVQPPGVYTATTTITAIPL